MKIENKTENTRPGAGIEFKVTKEHSIDDIKQAHKEGYSITFKGDENFIDLSPEDLSKLPKDLLVYYTVALKENQGKLGEITKTMAESNTLAREFGYDRRVADPKEQMKLTDEADGFHFKWVRAYDDQIAKHERKGYMIAPGNAAKSFANPDGKKSHHYVGSEDKPETVLMMISDENYSSNVARVKEASNLRKAAIKQAYIDKIERSGLVGAQAEVEGD